MKKLVISLLVVVMALGTMGMAFTTSLNFYGQDAVMASGSTYIEHVNCTGLYFHHIYEMHHCRPFFACDGIWVKFDKKLSPGTGIYVEVMGFGHHHNQVIATGHTVVPGPEPPIITSGGGHHPQGQWIPVPLDHPIWGHKISAANRVVVSVIGGEGMGGGPNPPHP